MKSATADNDRERRQDKERHLRHFKRKESLKDNLIIHFKPL